VCWLLQCSPLDKGPLDPAAPGVAAPLLAGAADSSGAPLGPSAYYFVSMAFEQPGDNPVPASNGAGAAAGGAVKGGLPEGLQLGPAIAFGRYGRAFAARWHGAKVRAPLQL
jgi:hypothetical protein